MKYFILFSLFTNLAWANVPRPEFSGNLEAQGRHSWNNEDAKKELAQNWDEEQFYLAYGNLNGKMEFENSNIEANWFVRHSFSELYREDPLTGRRYVAPLIYTFPRRLVARDLFKLQYENQTDEYKTESVLNKFFYERKMTNSSFLIGRIYINYGLGELFNPINPFNRPTGLTSISNVAQGNDGIGFTYFLTDTHIINFYALGDKSYYDYEGKISKTLWIRGEYQKTDKLQIDYILGVDQNRYKSGGQISYNFTDALVFSQVLYQSKTQNSGVSSNDLWDFLIGYDRQVTSKWHVRIETGYQEKSPSLAIGGLSERFLPSEYFIALANIYEIHPLVKLSGSVINDIETGFTYVITKSTFNLGNDMEADVFAFIPAVKGRDVSDNTVQKLITTDVGVSLRAFF